MSRDENPFSLNIDRYEQWYAEHPAAYQSELDAIRRFWPSSGMRLEVGAGAGHFAAPLGIDTAAEPSSTMRAAALKRGVSAVDGVAEALPFPDNRFDAVLMANTLAFVADKLKSLQEAFRVLRKGGLIVIAFVDRNSLLGKEYEKRRSKSAFYRNADFCTPPEVIASLTDCGFAAFGVCQTMFTHPDRMAVPDPVKDGYGEGSFIVIRGHKPEEPIC